MNKIIDSLTKEEKSILGKLNTPARIQDYINNLKPNYEKHGDTCRSPRVVMRTGTAHCIEGALLAGLAFYIHNEPPLLMDLTATRKDFDHVVALFKVHGNWGAISKSNHAVLRYREPIYRTLRELALSYFHEYFTDDGKKNLRSFSQALDLRQFNKNDWMISEEDLWYIPEKICDIRHFRLFNKKIERVLRPADHIEIKAGKLLEQ